MSHILAAGVGFHWNGIDGWLIFLACVSFALAILASIGKPARLAGLAITFIALGLLLWCLTGIVSG